MINPGNFNTGIGLREILVALEDAGWQVSNQGYYLIAKKKGRRTRTVFCELKDTATPLWSQNQHRHGIDQWRLDLLTVIQKTSTSIVQLAIYEKTTKHILWKSVVALESMNQPYNHMAYWPRDGMEIVRGQKLPPPKQVKGNK